MITWRGALAATMLLGCALLVALPVAMGGAALEQRLGAGPVAVTSLVARFLPHQFTITLGQGREALVRWRQIGLNWHWADPDWLEVNLAGLALDPLPGQHGPQAQLARGQVRLRLTPLLRRSVVVGRVTLDGLEATLPASMAQPAQPKQPAPAASTSATPSKSNPPSVRKPSSAHGQKGWHLDLSAFSTLALTHVRVQLQLAKGMGPTTPLLVSTPQLLVIHGGGTGPASGGDVWSGGGHVMLAMGGQALQAKLHLETVLAAAGAQSAWVGAPEQTLWQLQTDPIVPARLAPWLPQAAREALSPWQVPVAVQASGLWPSTAHGGQRAQATVQVDLGAGHMLQDKAPPLHFHDAHVVVTGSWEGGLAFRKAHINLPRIHFGMVDSAGRLVPVDGTGSMGWDDLQAGKAIELDARATMGEAHFANLLSLWPKGLAEGGRRWVGGNITAGTATGFVLHLHGKSAPTQAPGDLFGNVNLTTLEGHVHGHGLTVWWLRPVQPITGLEAEGVFINPNVIHIPLGGGHMRDGLGGFINVPKGDVLLTALMANTNYGTIKVDLNGHLPGVLKVLANRRLNLLSRYHLPLSHVAGDVKGQLKVFLPLDENVTMGQVGFNANVDMRRVQARAPVVQSIKDGQGKLHVTSDWMAFKGFAFMHGLPIHMRLWQNFDAPAPGMVMARANLRALVTPSALRKSGLDSDGHFTGQAAAETTVLQTHLGPKRNNLDIGLSLDLTKAGLLTPVWRKQAGVPAYSSAHAVWEGGHLVALDHLAADGPQLHVRGKAILLDNEVAGARLVPFDIGQTRAALEGLWPTAHHPERTWEANLRASVFDLAGALQPSQGPQKNPVKLEEEHPRAKPTPVQLPAGKWNVRLQADKLLYRPGVALGHVLATMAWDHRTLEQAQLDLESPYPLHARLMPDQRVPGDRTIALHTSNLGGVLNVMGITPLFQGGQTALEGRFHPDSMAVGTPEDHLGVGLGLMPFKGHLQVRHFDYVPAPKGKVTGGKAASGPSALAPAKATKPSDWFSGLNLDVDSEARDRVLTISNGLVENDLLGGTFKGNVDLGTRAMALHGTITPLYPLNSWPGRIPGIGWLFAPEKNSGLFSALYNVHGALNHPVVDLNGWALLLPGVLRLMLPH
ncbi:hypothetical protein E3E12_05660 [Formicincola oecophyllae]|uniref:Uncharacterized protein n=1 Tax=Formicincola oecophyllae TaxID=2558361 RepID=A0A4Y6UBB7_9PROT|nr:DUF3971 domain-containing protein [Formicincola oecophyllae]QDH13757.1 hypothetical protein E3E12_05660 [Formicincola oecophyllae]